MGRPRLAIPCLASANLRGSGFLGSIDGRVYFFTAAHGHFGHVDVTSEWTVWRRNLGVSFGGTDTRTPLFSDKGRPIFGYGYQGSSGSRIHDVIWLDVETLDPSFKHRLLASFEVIPVDGDYSEDIGEEVVAHGFPACRSPWPGGTACHSRGVIASFDAASYSTTVRTIGGYSGGPALSGEGRLVGMTLGHRDASVTNETTLLASHFLHHLVWKFEAFGPGALPYNRPR